MGNFFRLDGPFYKFGNILYYLIVTNLLWIIFSLPLFTIGASTTALFYVMGKVVRDEDISTFKDYWKSFKMNFKQATVVWVILAVVFLLIQFNLRNMNLMGNMAVYFRPFQIAVLLEMVIITVYIFPLLSRYNLKTKDLFKLSFFLGNRHIFSTISCLAGLLVIFYLFTSTKLTGVFVLIFVSLYALMSYYIIYRVFKKHMHQEQELEEKERDEE